jgi:hypothetical protein
LTPFPPHAYIHIDGLMAAGFLFNPSAAFGSVLNAAIARGFIHKSESGEASRHPCPPWT